MNTALGTRRWQYDFDVKHGIRLQEVKSLVLRAIQSAPGVLSDPEPRVVVVGVTADNTKLRALWSTHEPRQNQMLASYDQVLTAVAEAFGRIAHESPKSLAGVRN